MRVPSGVPLSVFCSRFACSLMCTVSSLLFFCSVLFCSCISVINSSDPLIIDSACLVSKRLATRHADSLVGKKVLDRSIKGEEADKRQGIIAKYRLQINPIKPIHACLIV